MHKLLKAEVAIGILAGTLLLSAVAAAADTASQMGSLAGSAVSQATPIVLAIAGALVALAILSWGVAWVFGVFSRRRVRV